MSTQPNNSIGRVQELDGLRGLLALWVALAHILVWCGFLDTTLPWPLSSAWGNFIQARSAVEVFFILSGFAISYLIGQRPTGYGAFIAGRFCRI